MHIFCFFVQIDRPNFCEFAQESRLERAREGRSVTRGALGSAWVVAAVMLHAFEYILRLGIRFFEGFFDGFLVIRN